jgi:hypothetical protein
MLRLGRGLHQPVDLAALRREALQEDPNGNLPQNRGQRIAVIGVRMGEHHRVELLDAACCQERQNHLPRALLP